MHLSRSLLAAGGLAAVFARACFGAEPVKADSAITAVTVYVDRAIVTRTAHVDLTEGAQDILFAGLPNSLDPDLLQVAGTGSAQATILDVQAIESQLTVPANPRLKELQDQLQAAQTEVRTLADRTSVLQQQRDFLERIKVAATTPPGKEGASLPTVDQWEKLATFYAEGLTKIAGQLQDVDHQQVDAKGRVDAIQREINQLRPPDARTVQDVLVRVDVTKPGSLEMKLEYTVNDAQWKPTYDVRVTSADQAIALGYSAMVSQSTGEDWHAVKLTLSTARPAVGGTPPELTPWYVREAQPQPLEEERKSRSAPRPAAAMASGAAADTLAMSALNVEAAAVERGLTAATFTIPHPTDVPADNAEHKIGITTHALAAELTDLAVPKLAELAYLRAAVTNTSGYPLIAGDVNLYLDGTFVAHSALKTVMPDEKFNLDLGVDDGISVKRRLLNRLTENTGIVSRKRQITYDVLITIQNNRATSATMIVRDQLPISQHERIVVELEAPPSREVKKEDDGTLTWNFDLAPGAKRELPLKIAVEYPADLPISGLE